MKRNVAGNFLGAIASALILFPSLLSAQQDPLIVGVVAPLTGPLSFIGTDLTAGVKFAAETINDRGGIGGRRLNVIVYDDTGQPAAAANIARKLIESDKANVLIGFPTSGSALAAREVAARSNTLFLPLSIAPAITGPDFRSTLRPIGKEDSLARMVVDYVKANFAGKKIGAWLPRNAPTFASSFEAAAKSRGVALARMDTDGALPNWSSDLDVVVVSPAVAPDVVRQLAAQNPKSTILVARSVVQEAELASLQAEENVRVIANPGPDFFSGAKEVVARAKSKNVPTGGLFIYGYAALQVFANLAAGAANTSGDALSAVARSREIPTAIDRLKFNAQGDLVGWRFAVWTRSGSSVAAFDVCKASDCKDYEQCPPDCPK